MQIRKARLSDAKRIKELMEDGSRAGELLIKPLSYIYENIRDFWVAQINDNVVGCCALHIVWDKLAEIRSLWVEEKYRGKGIGTNLVKSAISEAKDIGIEKVFVLTSNIKFFNKLGFKKTNKRKLPHKIWRECIECPKFPNCNEEALIYEINRG